MTHKEYEAMDRKHDYYENRLLPESDWPKVLTATLNDIRKEQEAREEGRAHRFRWVFSHSADIKAKHKKYNKSGAFMSEIRADEGAQAAKSLAELAPLIRLQKAGEERELLRACFDALWAEFSRSTYSRSYETDAIRAGLMYDLLSTNVLDLVSDKSWEDSMREYFKTDKSGWSQEPLIDKYRVINFGLDPDFESRPEDEWCANGELKLNRYHVRAKMQVEDYWGNFYDKIPYPKVAFYGSHLTRPEKQVLFKEVDGSDFRLGPIHIQRLIDRTRVVQKMRAEEAYTLDDILLLTDLDAEPARLAIGQAIHSGLMVFDDHKNLDWDDAAQQYQLTAAGAAL